MSHMIKSYLPDTCALKVTWFSAKSHSDYRTDLLNRIREEIFKVVKKF